MWAQPETPRSREREPGRFGLGLLLDDGQDVARRKDEVLLAGVLDLGRELGPDSVILVNLSGRGDKDVETASTYFGLAASGAGPGRAPADESS